MFRPFLAAAAALTVLVCGLPATASTPPVAVPEVRVQHVESVATESAPLVAYYHGRGYHRSYPSNYHRNRNYYRPNVNYHSRNYNYQRSNYSRSNRGYSRGYNSSRGYSHGYHHR